MYSRNKDSSFLSPQFTRSPFVQASLPFPGVRGLSGLYLPVAGDSGVFVYDRFGQVPRALGTLIPFMPLLLSGQCMLCYTSMMSVIL